MSETNEKARIPSQKRSIETRRSIINSAMELFSQKGFHNTNSKEIAAHAGVAIGSFYAYFEDKKQLFIEVLKCYNQQISERIHFDKNLELRDVDKFIYQLVDIILAAHDFKPGFHRELTTMRYSDQDVQLVMKELEDHQLDFTYKHLKAYEEVIKVKDLKTAAFIIFNTIQSIAHEYKFSKPVIEEESLKKELTDMIVNYLFKM